jgi:hypothetical protein
LNIRNDILSTLAYFDLFNYPLTKREVFLFLPNNHDFEAFDNAICELVVTSFIFKIGDFYSLQSNYDLLYRRKKGNKKAKDLMNTAEQVAGFLAKFPYVRAVGVSGSLSKEFADDQSDIDFFIITQKNRLWIARTIMHCFKKLTFLVNKQHFFCMNYYIDEAMLEINEKNIFTATEVVTLLPFVGDDTFRKFYAANTWTKNFLPNHRLRIAATKEGTHSKLKNLVEAMFNNYTGNLLDTFFMKLTSRRWFIKTRKKKLNSRGIVMCLHATKHFAKPDPTYFQNKLLESFSSRSKEIITKYENSMIKKISKN